ncbi:MAG: radical SAM protein, partial [Treponema sp.]|nr:radical SAM protein [Treponema sp.]
MKNNYSMIPLLLSKNLTLGKRLASGLLRIGKAKCVPKRDYGFNHFKNLSLVYFKPTGACNLRCRTCGQYGAKGVMNDIAAEENRKILPLDTWKGFIDQIAVQKPVIYVWGGEPFLYPDIFPLCKYMVDKGLFVSVNTNGTLMERHAEQIVRDRWSTVFVSLDAFRDVNDELRGQGAYDKVIAGFKAINREKEKQKTKYPLLAVVSVVSNRNYTDLANLAEASKEYKLDLHVVNLGTYTNDNIV